MIKTLTTTFCLFLFIGTIFAQNEQKVINAIKSSKNFLYATGTSTVSSEEASNNAKDLLALEIEQWLQESKANDIAGYVAKSRENLSQIKTKRGNLFRVFTYVKKKDILPYYKEEEVMVVDFVELQEQINKSTPEDAPAVTNKATEQLPVSEIQTEQHQDALSSVPTEQERVFLNIQSFTALNDFINCGREDKSIVEVGNYKNMPTTGVVYVFIHNKQGEIPACMKVIDGKPINLATGKTDAISNYKGCGAIWVKFDDE